MKIKNGYMLRDVAGYSVVVPVGEAALDFNGMINLNETGALLWRTLIDGADEKGLIDALLAEYDVSQEVAEKDVKSFIIKMREANLIDE